jgi:predicted DNA-binding ribbon-helix-helix protein
VIFATPESYFALVMVHHELRVPMSRSCNDTGGIMNTSIVKRSVVIAGHKTSVSLEDEFWMSFKQIAGYRLTTVSALLASVDSDRQHANLSSAIRLFVLDFYREQCVDGQEPVTMTHQSPLSPLQ